MGRDTGQGPSDPDGVAGMARRRPRSAHGRACCARLVRPRAGFQAERAENGRRRCVPAPAPPSPRSPASAASLGRWSPLSRAFSWAFTKQGAARPAGHEHGGVTYEGVTLHEPAAWHSNVGTGLSALMWFWVFVRWSKDGSTLLVRLRPLSAGCTAQGRCFVGAPPLLEGRTEPAAAQPASAPVAPGAAVRAQFGHAQHFEHELAHTLEDNPLLYKPGPQH